MICLIMLMLDSSWCSFGRRTSWIRERTRNSFILEGSAPTISWRPPDRLRMGAENQWSYLRPDADCLSRRMQAFWPRSWHELVQQHQSQLGIRELPGRMHLDFFDHTLCDAVRESVGAMIVGKCVTAQFSGNEAGQSL